MDVFYLQRFDNNTRIHIKITTWLKKCQLGRKASTQTNKRNYLVWAQSWFATNNKRFLNVVSHVWLGMDVVCLQRFANNTRIHIRILLFHVTVSKRWSLKCTSLLFFWCPSSSRDRKDVSHIWSTTCNFKQCGILTSVDTDEPVQHPFKLRNSKRCSVSSLTLIEYSSGKQ